MDVGTIAVGAITAVAAISGTMIGVVQQNRSARRQREAAMRDQRRSAYKEFLDVERELRTLLASGRRFTQAEYSKWAGSFFEQFHLIELLASVNVCRLARDLNRQFQSIDNERLSADEGGLMKSLTRSYQAHENDLERTREQLLEAMRADVAENAADRAPIMVPAVSAQPRKDSVVCRHVGLVSLDPSVPTSRLEEVARALQVQISRDLAPVWSVAARIEAFADEEDIPSDYWPIRVRHELEGEGVVAYRDLENGRPFGEVLGPNELGVEWTVSVSHTCMEMLVNPFQDRVIEGPSPKKGHETVQFPVEICNPCQDETCGYRIDGVLMSDFVTPHYFDLEKEPGLAYDHTGAVQRPRQICVGGYLQWYDTKTKHLRMGFGGSDDSSSDLGKYDDAAAALAAVAARGIGFWPRETGSAK